MTILKYQNLKNQDMQISVLRYEDEQARPRQERQITYFCRLCREYKIKNRKAHLQNFHNAKRDTVTKRSNDDLVDVIFIESK